MPPRLVCAALVGHHHGSRSYRKVHTFVGSLLFRILSAAFGVEGIVVVVTGVEV